MKKFFVTFCVLAVLSFLAFDTTAQIRTPAPSPSCKMEQTVGLTTVTLEYSRPSVKDRTIFAADGLVPYGQVWRTGANAATKITFSDDVKLGGQDIKAGSYAILTVPNATKWQIMLHEYDGRSWSSYKDKKPTAMVNAKVETLPIDVESFMISVGELRSNSAELQFIWENTYASVPLEVEVDSRVMKDIEKTLGGPSSGDYYAAGSYYHTSGKDLNKALEYVQKATKVDEPKFWQVRREALILADMGRYKEAIEAAKLSKDLAMKAENKDYVSMNEKSIAEWMAMKGNKKVKESKMKK